MNEYGMVAESNIWSRIADVFTVFNERQAARLFAINQLMNVAEYFNQEHAPLDAHVFTIEFSSITDSCVITADEFDELYYNGSVLFNRFSDAEAAIEILGEDVIKLALGVY
jgi:hypothetical protein